MFAELKEVNEAIAEFKAAKEIFDAVAQVPVHTPDGKVLPAIEEAKALLRLAAEHHVTIELAVKDLLDPKVAEDHTARLIKQAQDHGTELGKFLDQVKELVGAEYKVVKDVLEAQAAKKAAK